MLVAAVNSRLPVGCCTRTNPNALHANSNPLPSVIVMMLVALFGSCDVEHDGGDGRAATRLD